MPTSGRPFISFFFPWGGCQKLSFVSKSGRPRDQSLRTFSAFPRFVGVFGLLFQRPFRSLLENGLHPDRVRMVSLDCDFCCRLWGLVRRRCCKAKLEESFFPGGG